MTTTMTRQRRTCDLAADAARAALVEDVQWLVDTGECWSQAVIRTGYAGRADALDRRLDRAGRYDLVTALKARELSDWARNHHFRAA